MKNLDNFNPRTHEECDIKPWRLHGVKINFNPRTHEECDALRSDETACTCKFQSTHSRGVRRRLLISPTMSSLISIHALTRSATMVCFGCQQFCVLFQSTHSRGVRQFPVSLIWFHVMISIHALTRSATSNVTSAPCFSLYFNPRTHEECDEHVDRQLLLYNNFNPRTHEECDIMLVLISAGLIYFNPRTHEECDKRPKDRAL